MCRRRWRRGRAWAASCWGSTGGWDSSALPNRPFFVKHSPAAAVVCNGTPLQGAHDPSAGCCRCGPCHPGNCCQWQIMKPVLAVRLVLLRRAFFHQCDAGSAPVTLNSSPSGKQSKQRLGALAARAHTVTMAPACALEHGVAWLSSIFECAPCRPQRAAVMQQSPACERSSCAVDRGAGGSSCFRHTALRV